jgi:hypothetical protein
VKVEFGCPACGRAVEAEPGATARCRACGADAPLAAPAPGAPLACAACACPELYRHRDFSQRTGIAVVVAGCGLALALSSFLPLVAAAALDLLLWLVLPDVAICYRCKAHHRDLPGVRGLPSFDLERHEHHRFRKAREEGRLPPKGPA